MVHAWLLVHGLTAQHSAASLQQLLGPSARISRSSGDFAFVASRCVDHENADEDLARMHAILAAQVGVRVTPCRAPEPHACDDACCEHDEDDLDDIAPEPTNSVRGPAGSSSVV